MGWPVVGMPSGAPNYAGSGVAWEVNAGARAVAPAAWPNGSAAPWHGPPAGNGLNAFWSQSACRPSSEPAGGQAECGGRNWE